MEEAFEADLTVWFRKESVLLRAEIVKDLQRELNHLESSAAFKFAEDSYAAMFAVLMLVALLILGKFAFKAYQWCRRHVGLRGHKHAYFNAEGRRIRRPRR